MLLSSSGHVGRVALRQLPSLPSSSLLYARHSGRCPASASAGIQQAVRHFSAATVPPPSPPTPPAPSSAPATGTPTTAATEAAATATTTTTAFSSSATTNSTGNSDINAEPVVIVMDQSTHWKNAALATALVGFCVGVATYSMNTVGQAGAGGPDDPLAALKQEAAEAQMKQQQESQQTESAVDMLQKFQAGDYDPDLQEQLELEQAAKDAEGSKKKKAWWNFWSRG